MTRELSLNDVRSAFEPDGSLRDIYALETTQSEWESLVTLATSSPWSASLLLDETPTETGTAVGSLGSDGSRASMSLVIRGTQLNCHFFTADEIELDLDPKQITSANFDGLLEFIAATGQAIERNVFLSHEGSPTYGIFGYRLDADRFEVLQRRTTPGPLGRKIGQALGEILSHFQMDQQEDAEHREIPTSELASAAAARFGSIYAPNQFDWHTELTAPEFSALRELDIAFDIFFGPMTPEELCHRFGFKYNVLRKQFWQAVDKATACFTDMGFAS